MHNFSVSKSPALPLVLFLMCAGGSNADAQSEGFHSDRFSLAPSVEDGLALQLPNTLGHLRYSATAGVGFVSTPLASKMAGGDDFVVVGSHFATALAFGLGLSDAFELSVRMNAALGQSSDDGASIGLAALPTTGSGGISDMTVGAAYQLLGQKGSPLQLGLEANVRLPTGSQEAFTGDGGIGAGGSVMASYGLSRVTLAAQAGAVYRPERNYALLQSGSEAFVRLAAHAPVLDNRVRVMLEIDGRTDLHDNRVFTQHGSPLQALAGARYAVTDTIQIGALAGVGLLRASNEPALRALATLSFSSATDTKSSFSDHNEMVVAVAEEPTAGDTIPESPAPDPTEPFVATEPAPTEPTQTEEPIVVEPTTTEPPTTIPTPVTPVVGTQNMSQVEAQAQMPSNLIFVSGISELDGNIEGRLDDLVTLLNEHPEVLKLQVRGHASSEGSARINKKISLQRAKNVLRYLVKKGIKRSRLTPYGAGASEPLVADDSSDEARRRNRRVEILVLKTK